MGWEKVPLGDILSESRIPCKNPDPDRRIRVKLHIGGVEKRPLENEMKGATKQYIRQAGQFIFGKQNFHKGAFGVIPADLDGFETSADIPSFDVREDCLPEWLFYYFKSGNRYLELEKLARGVGSQRIHPKQIYNIEIPLPPKEIQHRIIETLINTEGQFYDIKDEQSHQLVLLKKLRQQILQDAVQGKLVPQDPNDEPASELLERIKAEKEKLVQEKKIKEDKPMPEIKAEEIPFEIHENWVWCRLGEVIELISGQDLRPNEYSANNSEGVPYITGASNLLEESVIINRWTKTPKSFAVEGDLLLTCKGSGVGKMAYLYEKSVHIARQIMAIRSRFIPVKYVKRVVEMNVTSFKSKAKSLIPGIDRELVLNTIFSLPPLPEQHRIVTKIEQLMTLCDELEQSIQQNQKYTQELLQVALKEALQPD